MSVREATVFNGSLKYFLGIIAIIGGLSAIIAPMNQTIVNNKEILEKEITNLRDELWRSNTHINDVNAEKDENARKIAEAMQKFSEVETQFHNLDERTERIERMTNVRDDAQTAEIQHLTTIVLENMLPRLTLLDGKPSQTVVPGPVERRGTP